ncbi:MAG: DUF1461 domain-containing protein [Clostridia bacterium]|nr:DUF1461 domain-containing protein [Clostridia bacterium]
MKKLKKAAAIIAAVLLLFGLLTIALNFIFNYTGWLYKEYLCELKNSVYEEYGISAEDASRVLSRMMYYSTGRADDLDVTIVENGEEVPFFNESELSHMRDVRKLTRTVLWMGAVSLVLALAAIVFLIASRDRAALRTFAKAYLIALAAAVVIIIALAVWVLVDFDGFWTTFHVVFLDLESSTFDPAESRMIRICPAELFADFVGMLGNIIAILAGAVGIACVLYLRFTKKKNA